MQLPTGKTNLMMNMNLLTKVSERSYLSPCIFGGRKKESGVEGGSIVGLGPNLWHLMLSPGRQC